MKSQFFLTILSLTLFTTSSFAQLDKQREDSYQRVLNRYSTSTESKDENTTPPINLNTKEEEQEDEEKYHTDFGGSFTRNSLNISGDNIEERKQFFGFMIKEGDEETLRLDSFAFSTEELLTFGVELNSEETLSYNIFNEIKSTPGTTIVIKSDTSFRRSDELKAFSTSLSREQDSGSFKYILFGEIAFQEPTEDIRDNRVSVLTTIGFNPCLLEAGVSNTVRNHLLEKRRDQQTQIDLAAHCIVGEDFEGKIFASLILTDINGDFYEQVHLETELTLKIAESLYLRYNLTNRPEPSLPSLGRHYPRFESKRVERPIRLSAEESFFYSLHDASGKLETITLEYKTDEKQECIKTKGITLGAYKNSLESESTKPVFLIESLDDCDPNRITDEDEDIFEAPDLDGDDFDEELANAVTSSTSLSFGNIHKVNGHDALAFSFSKASSDSTHLNKYSVFVAEVNDSLSEDGQYRLYEVGINRRNLNQSGSINETNFRIIKNQDNTYAVAERVFIAPINNAQNRLKFQKPQISNEDREKALARGITESQLEAALNNFFSIDSLNYCREIDCFELGLGLSFSDQGGVFLTARGETVVDIFDKNFDLELTFGLPLNEFAENYSWGRHYENDRPFYEISFSDSDCDKSETFCAELSNRKDSESNTIQFVYEYEF